MGRTSILGPFLFTLNRHVFQAAVVSEGVARWEDNKKWQQKVETLKGKLAEKTRELEKAEKTIGMLRDAVSRAEKDKAGLHSRLKRYVMVRSYFVSSKVILYALITYIHCSSAKSSTGGQALVTNEVVQDLRQNIFKLEEEVSFFFTYCNDDQIHS